MWKDFKEFASQGNVMDLAVAVIIGGAFGKIVSSLVDNIIMPIIGLLLGGLSFEGLKFTIGDANIEYGVFIQNVVDFFIIALSIFLFIRLINSVRRKHDEEEEETEELDEQTKLLTEIRDLLKHQKES
ncbi:MAG TPA: large conductance mechanosensitive channel protein MscL [Bacillus bacterium]|uniref:Large-conductance mechanosensitive channel n=1 Tax=Siminovitchia fordii TaxID=254759 RepID=A0ABQ4K3S7_9BACI|nr:large conductance mechanosensitive channel protein MscL [Siminovitchia fordii]GIN19815.1 large-conductance mechanosensitive channel [Siminovitchia fordii]HBZ10900.1 large conductance mechanosensitive channel protein MscL [Bacillus sp. (in: firmicutes)]